MGKFKVDDYIRIADPQDMGYKFNHLYKVVRVTETGYELLSLKYNKVCSEEFLYKAITEYLKNDAGHKTVKDYFDNYYRLATPQEIVLYGRE